MSRNRASDEPRRTPPPDPVAEARREPALSRLLHRLPGLWGAPISLEWRPSLRVVGRRLESGPGPGLEVHAASFIRRRRIVLDRELLRHPGELARIFTHELFHFVWVRLNNRERASWAALLASERGRGELGWSAQLRRNRLSPASVASNSRAWRLYCCESFCDTAAWFFARRARHHEFTLGARAGRARASWFERWLAARKGTIKV